MHVEENSVSNQRFIVLLFLTVPADQQNAQRIQHEPTASCPPMAGSACHAAAWKAKQFLAERGETSGLRRGDAGTGKALPHFPAAPQPHFILFMKEEHSCGLVPSRKTLNICCLQMEIKRRWIWRVPGVKLAGGGGGNVQAKNRMCGPL